jgi:hypothetical protein
MKLRARDSNAPPIFSRPIGLDPKTWRYVEPILEALQLAQQEPGRFKYYGYLIAVYRAYKDWKDQGISKKMARRVVKYCKIPYRKGTIPIRTLLDATFPALDPKRKSRWSRALECAAMMKVSPDDLPKLFKNSSGIAGCARLATKRRPKKNTYRDDWGSGPCS